jgi:hypothetical protein
MQQCRLTRAQGLNMAESKGTSAIGILMTAGIILSVAKLLTGWPALAYWQLLSPIWRPIYPC